MAGSLHAHTKSSFACNFFHATEASLSFCMSYFVLLKVSSPERVKNAVFRVLHEQVFPSSLLRSLINMQVDKRTGPLPRHVRVGRMS